MPQAVFLGLVFPQILKLAQQIVLQNRQKRKLVLHKIVQFLQSYSSIIVIGFICILIFVPNVKFMRTEDGYMIRKFFFIICVPLASFYSLVFYEICKIALQYWGSTTGRGISQSQSPLIVKFLFLSFLILKCFLINRNYINWMQREQKLFFDIFLMIIFFIIDLSNCKIFNSIKFASADVKIPEF